MSRQWYIPRDNFTISDRALKIFVLIRENVALSAMRIILPDNFLTTQQIDRVSFIRIFLLYHTPLSSPLSRVIYLESIIRRRIETNWQKLLETAPSLILLKLSISYISFFFKLVKSLCFFFTYSIEHIIFILDVVRTRVFKRCENTRKKKMLTKKRIWIT